MASDQPVCGYPTSKGDGSPCQRSVDREGLRCPHHPRTPDEQLGEAPQQLASSYGGP